MINYGKRSGSMSAAINPILLEFPESLETERMLIRAPQWGDGLPKNQALRESINELRPWLPFAKTIPTIEESEAGVRKARLNFLERTDLMLHLFDIKTGEFIGSSGLHRIDWDLRSFEIGYWIRTSKAGHGLMTEAVNGITNYAITHMQARRLEIRCDAANLSSSRVAQRAGFTLEGILRKVRCDENGMLGDTMIFSKVTGVEF
jgi:ribosomal-protein-serine acetyltransferase